MHDGLGQLAQIVARLQHPAIVSVFDFGTFADGGAYLVMELVRGEDLRRVLQREGRLEPQRALPILSTVCAAIEAAHREGVLHRDLKPENILRPGGDIEAKVLDFGVAKVIDERQTAPAEAVTMVTAAGMIQCRCTTRPARPNRDKIEMKNIGQQ